MKGRTTALIEKENVHVQEHKADLACFKTLEVTLTS